MQAWLFLLLLTGAHLIVPRKQYFPRRTLDSIQSFAAGVAIGYVFLALLPELVEVSRTSHIDVWPLITGGIVAFHSAMKLVFKNSEGKRRSELLSEELHLITALTYNFLVSYSVVELTISDWRRNWILPVVILVHTVLSEISHPDKDKNWIILVKRPALAFVSLIGGLLAVFTTMPDIYRVVLFAVTAGAVIYISIREEIPQKDEGRPIFFILGTGFTLLLMSYY